MSYRTGDLERVIKNLVLDTLAERLSLGEAGERREEGRDDRSDNQERVGRNQRGRVTDPVHDRRLKQNRAA